MINASNINSISKDDKLDIKLVKFIATYYVIEAINKSLKVVFPISSTLWQMMSFGLMIFLLGIMLLTISPVLKRNLRSLIIVESIFLFLYLFSMLQGNADVKLLFRTAFQTMGVCIPLAMYVYSIKNFDLFYTMHIKVSYLLIIILSLSLYSMSNKGDAIYNMSLSYSLLVPTLFQYSQYNKSRSFINLVFFLIGFTYILLYGARGPIINVGYLILLGLITRKDSYQKKFWTIIITSVAMGLLFMYYDKLAMILLNYFQSKGIYSRTLNSIVQGTISDSSGRIELFNYYWKLVTEKPFGGWGLIGGWIGLGHGPHNMILEFFLAFGFFGGVLLSIGMVSLMMRVFFIKSSTLKSLLMIFSSSNVMMFLAMGNFLEKVNLFIFIALSFSTYKNTSKSD